MTDDEQVDRSSARRRAIRRTALGVIAIVGWIVLSGIVWRQVPAQPERANLTAAVGLSEPVITVEPGMTLAELGAVLEELGLDTAARTVALGTSPAELDLPEQLDGIDSLDGYLAPGRYTITPTSDAPTLLTRMATAFAEQLTDPLLEQVAASGLSVADVVRVAGLAQAGASTEAELPVVAGVIRNQATYDDGELGAVGPAALAAALQPITTTAAEFHHAADGSVRLGPARQQTRPPNAAELDQLASSLVDPLGAASSILVVDLANTVILDQGSRRFVRTASLYKLAVLAVAMDEVEAGRLDLDERVGAQLPRRVDEGTAEPLAAEVELREALRRMVETSDNASAEALLFGMGPDVVNRRLRSWGVVEFNVGSRPQVATAHGVAQLLRIIVSGQHHDEDSVVLMVDWLENTPQDDRLPRLIPGSGPIAHKAGDLARTVNDAGVLPTPAGPVIVVAMIDDVDERLAASDAIAGLGQLVNSWFTLYLPAQDSATAGERGCERSPTATTGPLMGARIVVDAAHGGQDVGTVALTTEGTFVIEATATLQHAEALARALTDRGARVLLTRCRDQTRAAATRAVLANDWGADLLLSIDYGGVSADATDNGARIIYARSDAAVWAGAFVDEDRAISAWPQPDDPSAGMAATVIVGSPVLLHLTVMPGVLIGPGDLAHGPETRAVWEAAEGDGGRLDELAAITAGRVTAVWETSGAQDRDS